jgi:tetratricopeptide (TPR) repeat protein
MQRKLNVKLVLVLLGSLLVLSVAVHFWHGYQLRQNARYLLDRADRAMSERQLDAALIYYAQYLNFVPNDVDTVQKYAETMDASGDADRVQVVLLIEQVLRAKPNEDALRIRLVHNLITLGRVAEAIEQLRSVQSRWPDQAEIQHMLGWCHDANKDYPQAVQALEAAIKANRHQRKSYALLAEVWLDRLNQPDEALKVMNALVDANGHAHQAYLMRARFQRRRGDMNAAENDLLEAYTRKRDSAEVILEVADAFLVKDNFAEAESMLQDGIKRHPREPAFYQMLAEVKLRTKHDADALRILEDGLKQTPKSADLAIRRIDLLLDQGKNADAKANIDELRKSGLKQTLPDYLTARLRVADQRWNDAIALLELARKDLPSSSEWLGRTQVLLGYCYQQIGDPEQALQAYRRAVRAEPAWMTANLGLAETLWQQGRVEEASQVLEPLATRKDVSAAYWFLLTHCRLGMQMRLPESERRFDAVEQAFAHAGKLEPKAAALPLVRGELMVAQKNYAGAQQVLDQARAAHPDSADLWCARAHLAVLQQNDDEAERILEQALQQPALRDAIEVRLAQVRLWGRRARNDDLAKLARLGHSDSTPLLREIADTWHRLGVWDRAETLLRELARTLPKDLRSRLALFDLALQKDQPLAARQWRNELRAIEGEQGWLWRYADVALLVHEAHGRRNQLAVARKQLEELDRLHPHAPRIAVLLGTIDELEGKHSHAIEQYTRALQRGETQPRVLVRVLELLVQRREFSKAETEFAKFEPRWPMTRELARLGADIALGMRDPQYAKLAVKRAELAVTLPTRDYRDALWLARIHQAAGETAKAEALYRASLDQADHTPDTWIAWMTHLANTQQKRDLALRELERMKQAITGSRQSLTLARCYDALHLLAQAERAYQDALRERPSDFIALSYAADFYRRADLAAQAIGCYERLLDPMRPAPAEIALTARRQFAVLLAQQSKLADALALLANNRQALGDTLADERIRWFVESQSEFQRDRAIGKFQDSLQRQVPTPNERALLAQMLESVGALGQARTQLAEAVHEQATPMLLVRYARLLIQLAELPEAERTVARLEALEPESPRVRELRKSINQASATPSR